MPRQTLRAQRRVVRAEAQLQSLRRLNAAAEKRPQRVEHGERLGPCITRMDQLRRSQNEGNWLCYLNTYAHQQVLL
jgi:hypothetical protein